MILFRFQIITAVLEIWKRNKIITERPPVHTMPAWKPSEDGTKWKRNSYRYQMKTELYPASCEHLSIRNRIMTVPGQWCRFQVIPASCERGLKQMFRNGTYCFSNEQYAISCRCLHASLLQWELTILEVISLSRVCVNKKNVNSNWKRCFLCGFSPPT